MGKNKTPDYTLRAIKNYTDKHDRITAIFPAGFKDRLKALGYTPGSFVKQAALEKLERIESEKEK